MVKENKTTTKIKNNVKTAKSTKLTKPKKITNSKPKKIKYEKTTKKHLNEMSKFKFDSLKLEISIIQRFTENLDVPIIEDLETEEEY
jgi:hypothetical protein